LSCSPQSVENVQSSRTETADRFERELEGVEPLTGLRITIELQNPPAAQGRFRGIGAIHGVLHGRSLPQTPISHECFKVCDFHRSVASIFREIGGAE
jgi:hypothetical protein